MLLGKLLLSSSLLLLITSNVCAIELDADDNGYLDAEYGVFNVGTAGEARTYLDIYSKSESDDSSGRSIVLPLLTPDPYDSGWNGSYKFVDQDSVYDEIEQKADSSTFADQTIFEATYFTLPTGSGTGGYVSTPTYSDESCTTGQWSFDTSYIYVCEATDQWDRYAITFAGWSNPTPSASVDFYWNGDHGSGTNYATVTAGSLACTISGASISTTRSYSGNALYTDGSQDEYIECPVTSKDIFDSAEGSMTIWLNVDVSNTYSNIFEAFETDGVNEFYIYFQSDNTMAIQHEGSNSRKSLYMTQTFTDDTDFWLQVEWSATSNILRARICDDEACDTESWEYSVDSDPLTAFSTEPSYVRLGERYTNLYVSLAQYYDEWKIWTSYDQH